MKFIERIGQYRDRNLLSYRLVLAVMLCSLFFTLLVAAVQLHIEYRRDVEATRQNIHFLEESYLPAFASSAYNFDRDLLRIQLEGALQLNGIFCTKGEASTCHQYPLPRESGARSG